MKPMKWLQRFFKQDNGDDQAGSQTEVQMTLRELSAETDIKYITLYRAIREDRLDATQSGSIWLSSVEAVNRAIAEGKIRGER